MGPDDLRQNGKPKADSSGRGAYQTLTEDRSAINATGSAVEGVGVEQIGENRAFQRFWRLWVYLYVSLAALQGQHLQGVVPQAISLGRKKLWGCLRF